jgi:hypothetical protein
MKSMLDELLDSGADYAVLLEDETIFVSDPAVEAGLISARQSMAEGAAFEERRAVELAAMEQTMSPGSVSPDSPLPAGGGYIEFEGVGTDE